MLDSPIQLSQKDIDDVLTTLAATPSTPILRGFGQPKLTTQDLQCSICRNAGHITDYCNNSPLQSITKCFCCGETGHKVSQCSHKCYSPTTVGTPRNIAPSALSSTSPAQPAVSLVHPFALSSPDTSIARTAQNSLSGPRH